MSDEKPVTPDEVKEAGKRAVELGLCTPLELAELALKTCANSADIGALYRHLERQGLLTPYQIQKLLKGDANGYFIGRFKIQYKIAAGAFARVFRGVDTQTGEVVAVKVLRDRHSLDGDTVRNFYREASLTKTLSHPNITRTIEVDVDSQTNQHYIAMEFVEGGNFREFLRIRGRIEPREMVRLAKEMAEGLRYALAQGITHRDIRLKNVLVSAIGRVKWVDFGLAGVSTVAEQQRPNSSGFSTEQRTIDYAALEKATNAPKGDPRSDIFFLGAIYYQMLTAESPLPDFKGAQVAQIRPSFATIRPLSRWPEIPKELAEIVERMLAYHPSARYQNYDEILRDLNNLEISKLLPGQDSELPGERPRTIVVHKSPKAQETLRATLTDLGYHVVLTADMQRAINIYNLKPARCLIIDLDTTGEEGVAEFTRLTSGSPANGQGCSAIFLAEGDQKAWTESIRYPRAVTLEKPLTLAQVYRALKKLVPRDRAR